MKRFIVILLGALALVFTGCSSDDDVENPGGINSEVISGLQLTGSVATYSRISLDLYNRDSQSNGEWEKIDLLTYSGFIPETDPTFIFQDGKIWKEESYSSVPHNPEPLGLIWAAYCEVAHENRDLYVGRDFSYDDETKQFVIKDNKRGYNVADQTLEVTSFNEEYMVLSDVSHYDGGRTGEGGEQKETAVYRRTSTDRMDESKILAFDSQYECDMYVWQKGYDTFGRYVTVNEIFGPEVILDSPVIDIERWKPQPKK